VRAELDASLCIPEESPIDLEVDPIELHAALSGLESAVTIAPLELDLPKITTVLPGLTVVLPQPKIRIRINLASFDLAAITNWITTWKALTDSTAAAQLLNLPGSILNLLGGIPGPPPQVPPPVPTVGEVMFVLPAITLASLATPALFLPQPEIDIDIDLGKIDVTFTGPVQVDMGNVMLHSNDAPPLTAGLAMPTVGLDASVGPLNAELDGCIVLNGGDHKRVSFPTPVPVGAKPHVMAVKSKLGKPPDGFVPATPTLLELTVFGEGFGTSRGAGAVRLKGQGAAGTHSPLQYVTWSDSEIQTLFWPLADGTYSVLVTASDGVDAEPLMTTLP
jgi:hypothetical protein